LTDLLGVAADRLIAAARTRTPCVPVRDLIGPDDADAAYAVQGLVLADRQASGARVLGRKVGLTAPAVQAQLGVDRPDFGWLLDDMRCAEGEVPLGRLLQPKVEAEVAFVLAADIDDPHANASSVRRAVDYAVAALEIVDSRIAGWDISFADTVADNASSGLFVLGARQVELGAFEPREVTMQMTIDGMLASTGSGQDCLGDPLAALAWLAATAARFGDPLRAGEVVLSGALGPMAAVQPGVTVQADISTLGTVAALCTNGNPA
jgi:2-keto-4-pentenoate hydratase